MRPSAATAPPTLDTQSDTLAFSAGGDSSDLHKWRRVDAAKGRHISSLARLFPDLGPRFLTPSPFVVSCYSATLGRIEGGTFVDTYLRPQTFSRALLLARSLERPVVLIGQPLSLADLLLAHIDAGHALPGGMLVVLGGYACPPELEILLREVLGEHAADHEILHAYGVAEIEYGCLMGRRDRHGVIVYRPATPHIRPIVIEGELWLELDRGEGGFRTLCATGDCAEVRRDGICVLPGRARVDRAVWAQLCSWSASDWRRRTGYVRGDGDQLSIQLRSRVKPTHRNERSFHSFAEQYGMSFLDKPNWQFGTSVCG